MIEGHTICKSCGEEIDPEVCWCGQLIVEHSIVSGCTYALPMGCECLRDTGGHRQAAEGTGL